MSTFVSNIPSTSARINAMSRLGGAYVYDYRIEEQVVEPSENSRSRGSALGRPILLALAGAVAAFISLMLTMVIGPVVAAPAMFLFGPAVLVLVVLLPVIAVYIAAKSAAKVIDVVDGLI